MPSNLYQLITWPEIQEPMDYPGFREHACLANDEYFIDTYGSSAYFVNSQWLEKNRKRKSINQ